MGASNAAGTLLGWSRERECPELKEPHIDNELDRSELREIYDLERELAGRLRSAPPELRKRLYAPVYEEYYRRLPHHPMLNRSRDSIDKRLEFQTRQILPFIPKGDCAFMEVGAGDCAVPAEMAQYCTKVYALDVQERLASVRRLPPNAEFIPFDGFTIPLADSSVNVAFSNQLIEHLHPDDALEHAKSIYDVLVKGGTYVCITCSGLDGPHDISRQFGDEPVGFHLKEYRIHELSALLKRAGFSQIYKFLITRRGMIRLPSPLVSLVERSMGRLPLKARRWLTTRTSLGWVVTPTIAAVK